MFVYKHTETLEYVYKLHGWITRKFLGLWNIQGIPFISIKS